MGDYGVVTTRRPPTPRSRVRTGASPRGGTSPRAGTARRSTTRAPSRASSTRPRTRRGPAGRPHTGPQAAKTARTGASAPRRAEEEQPAQPRQITVRGLVLFVVVLMAFIVLAPTLRAYVNQQEEHRQLAAQISDTKDHNEQLRQEIERWDSEAYIKAEARERLGFVLPGQTPYRVVDPQVITGEEAPIARSNNEQGPVEVAPSGPWYLTVWDSVQMAGEVDE